MRSNDAEIKKFLLENMYRHYKLNRMTSKGRRVVKDLFSLLVDEPGCLPSEWQKKVGSSDKATTAQIVADFVGGMTDRFALDEHRRLFDLQSRIS
jgi:dGTPase